MISEAKQGSAHLSNLAESHERWSGFIGHTNALLMQRTG
ncbi:hypothetical protein P367_23805 [Comamonas thiooxydans]|nr:hypothetical protein P367_23805 [Comamonas thiooxydans]